MNKVEIFLRVITANANVVNVSRTFDLPGFVPQVGTLVRLGDEAAFIDEVEYDVDGRYWACEMTMEERYRYRDAEDACKSFEATGWECVSINENTKDDPS